MMRDSSPTLAIYLRTSLEDYGKAHQLIDQSCSIVNQRKLIQRFLSESEEWKDWNRVEYIDDGYTGTDLDRPRFRDMIGDMERRRISCVIVKDLSRFGRSYLEVGEYLEKIFPAAGVRVIAVNDAYDSQQLRGTTGGMDVAFRNFIYDSYSKDLSVKVRSAMHTRMEHGKFVNHTPYGYRKDPGDKHQMAPDPETAPIVREIFLLTLAGKTTAQIATLLNDRGVLTPLQYKRHKLKRVCQDRELLWSHITVVNILHNYKYTGAMVNHTRESRHLRDKNQRRTSPEEWIVTEGAHEPIVTQEEFERANAMLRHPRKTTKKAPKARDAVFYCGHCGRKLRRTHGKDTYFSCETPSYQTDALCRGLRWSKTDLENVLLPIYRARLDLLGQEAAARLVSHAPDGAAFLQRMARLEREIDQCGHDKMGLFEAYHEDRMALAAYLEQKTALTQRAERLREERKQVEAEYQAQRELREREEAEARRLADYLSAGSVPEEEGLLERMYQAIDRVLVFDSVHIEVRWKFEDLFATGEKKRTSA